MLSFIVIGRNEGWKLKKCLESIYKTIEQNKLINSEVIYVDSQSTDNSIKHAKAFENIKVFLITGKCNAAIARNIGARESSGDVLFFIDGDMEIQGNFLPLVYNEKSGLIHEFISGRWINYNYSHDGELRSKEKYIESEFKDQFHFTTGGLFFITKHIWESVNGMKAKMKVNEDLDIGLRLAKKNTRLLRKKELLAIHHTVPYTDRIRIWRILFSGNLMYRIVLLRDNFLNKYEWKLFLRGNYTFMILFFSILLSFISHNPLGLLFYFGAVIMRTLSRKEKNLRLFITNLIYFPIYEISLIFGFFLFWPSTPTIEYVKEKIYDDPKCKDVPHVEEITLEKSEIDNGKISKSNEL
ncbi:MAG: glycosyltransferase [Lentimicrobium sp.]